MSSDVLLSRVDVEGAVWLGAADIGGDLDLRMATLVGAATEDLPGAPYPTALSATDASVGGAVVFWSNTKVDGTESSDSERRFSAHGGIRFQRVNVKNFNLQGARIEVEGSSPESIGSAALDLSYSSVAGILSLIENSLSGPVNLSHTRVDILADLQSGYDKSRLYLDGFRYRTLYRDPGSTETVSDRLKWLEGMGTNHYPQPYIQLARVLAAEGRSDDAYDVLIEKYDRELWLKWKVCGSGIQGVASRCGAGLIGSCGWLFGRLFGYGFKPVRAIRTLLASILLGYLLFFLANESGYMRVDQLAVAGAVGNTVSDAKTMGAQVTSGSVLGRVQCDDSVSNLLYAIDVFIPLLDLRQESKCEMGFARTDENENEKKTHASISLFLSVGKALYAILGWIVVSLSILTFSGVLQRRGLSED